MKVLIKGRLRNRVAPADKKPHGFYKGMEPHPAAKEARAHGHTFSNVLRDILIKPRKYRKPDGSTFESTELQLIIQRAVKELRTGTEFDVRLLALIMERHDGKIKEPIDVEGIKEVANDLNAHDIILSRLGGIILARGHTEDDSGSESSGSTGSAVRVGPLGKN